MDATILAQLFCIAIILSIWLGLNVIITAIIKITTAISHKYFNTKNKYNEF